MAVMCSKANGHDSVIFGSVSKRIFYQTDWKRKQAPADTTSFKNNSCTMIVAVIVALLHVVAVSVLDTHITHAASLMLKRPLQCPRFRLQSHFIRFTFHWCVYFTFYSLKLQSRIWILNCFTSTLLHLDNWETSLWAMWMHYTCQDW